MTAGHLNATTCGHISRNLRHFPGEDGLSCTICMQNFDSRFEGLLHLEARHKSLFGGQQPYSQLIGRQDRPIWLDSHSQTLSEDASSKQKSFTCYLCSNSSKSRYYIYYHYAAVHFRKEICDNYPRGSKCPLCNKKLKDEQSVLSHMGVSHDLVESFLEPRHHIARAKQGEKRRVEQQPRVGSDKEGWDNNNHPRTLQPRLQPLDIVSLEEPSGHGHDVDKSGYEAEHDPLLIVEPDDDCEILEMVSSTRSPMLMFSTTAVDNGGYTCCDAVGEGVKAALKRANSVEESINVVEECMDTATEDSGTVEEDGDKEDSNSKRDNRDTNRHDSNILRDNSDVIRDSGDIVKVDGDTLREDGKINRDNGNTIRQDNKTVRGNGNTIRVNGDTVREDSKTNKDNGNTIRQINKTVRGNRNTIRVNGDTVREDRETDRDNGNTIRQNNKTVRGNSDTIRVHGDTIREDSQIVRENGIRHNSKQVRDNGDTIGVDGDTGDTIRKDSDTVTEDTKTIRDNDSALRVDGDTFREDTEGGNLSIVITNVWTIGQPEASLSNQPEESTDFPKQMCTTAPRLLEAADRAVSHESDHGNPPTTDLIRELVRMVDIPSFPASPGSSADQHDVPSKMIPGQASSSHALASSLHEATSSLHAEASSSLVMLSSCHVAASSLHVSARGPSMAANLIDRQALIKDCFEGWSSDEDSE